MNDRITVLEHKGNKILLADFSNLPPEKIVELIPQYTKIGLEQKISLYALDITDTITTEEIKDASRISIGSITAALGKIHVVLVGLRGIQKIIANAISKEQHFASTREEGYDWLVKQTEK